MQYRLLGEVEAVQAGCALPLGGRRNSAVLALLLLHANRPVRSDDIAAQVWGPHDPPSLVTVQAQVHRLRRRLPGADIATTPSGYVLRVDPQAIDARRFEARLAAAQAAITAGRHGDCAQAASEALAMWRGPALADLLGHDFATEEHARLEELRRETEELQADALLESNPTAVVAAAQRMVSEAPLRERRWALLMRALYLTGRQAEALAVYARVRRLLDHQLGIQPGPELQELQQRILRHDLAHIGQPAATTSTPLRIRYARTNDGAYLAFETFGSGVPLVVVAGNWSGLTIRQNPLSAPFAARLGRLARVTCYDARGLGLSDPIGSRLPTVDDRTEELIAVADAVAADRFVLYGFSDGGAAAIHAAATMPERVAGLVLHNAAAAWTDERGRGFDIAGDDELVAAYDLNWGSGSTIGLYAPTLADDPLARRWWAHGERHAARPGEVPKLNAAARAIDVRPDLANITAPTLLIHGATNTAVPVAHARYLADHIVGARLVETPTPDHTMWSAGHLVLPEVSRFLTELALT